RFTPHLGSSTAHIVDKAEHGFVLFDREGNRETYNVFGHLTSATDRFGNGVDITLEPTPLGALHRRYCSRIPNEIAVETFDIDPLICSYLSFAIGGQAAE